MLRVLAVDDEVPALEEMAYLLQRDPRIAEVVTAGDATSAMRLISDRVAAEDHLDALFLDIHMPGPSGIDLARFISALALPPAVVFVTAHEDFALTAFELRAVDYLLKPLREERLADTVERLTRLRPGRPDRNRVPVELGGRVRFIERSEIWYVEARGDYVRLRTAEGSFLIRSTLGALERDWAGDGFVRIHRSVLVAARHVSELHLDGARAKVKVGEELLLVSRRQTRDVRDQLMRRLAGEGGGR
ncbi:LytR/AlgR family response regulator transcription factor [Marinitenerispora sediminis]|uniref:DNA-binding response regulator n=1 Tax=Marinitenerispora sediminis TaxID=1931232 RepID=A0A368TCF2_9ACTN|nr:LytTR family DNA-binding domain-containing protein [Marinitenerispora sediminis]RCV55282.1 DNA-binding response regulator [Marinitenerispora sediminis]RCV61613.1 DNA-binding response regulator [Marinitenerispora sediminis]RCV62656.1 DNA-binding response regulator [Marinitenerispora sediminis]